jgi:GH24 family phage-related lysozyme (muramidase)
MARKYTKEEIEQLREVDPTFKLSKSEALKYAAKMGASDSLRGLQQIGAKFFGADEAVERLKEQDKKLQAILNNKTYGTAATGTFLSSAVIADPVGWIPILGTAKKAKNIYQLAKYGGMAGGFHSGIGYVSEDAPGLLGEKQSRLENTLIGVGAGGALGTLSGGVVNAIAKSRGKPMVYGLTKDIEVPSKIDEAPLPSMKSKEDIATAERKTQDDYYEQQFGQPRPKTKEATQDDYYDARFSDDVDEDKAINEIVKENLKEGSQKTNSVLKFYQDNFGIEAKDLIFNNAGTSLVGFGSALGSYNSNDDPNATISEKLTTAVITGLSAGAVVNMAGRVRSGDELVSEKIGRFFIDDYGLTDEYKLLRKELQVNNNSHALKFLKLAKEAQEKLSDKERRVFYNLMVGDLESLDKIAAKGDKTDLPTTADLKDISEEGLRIVAESRELITEMGQKYVDEGLLSKDVFLKNAKTYLHRSYQRSLADVKDGNATANAAREISLIGDNLKPRGDVKDLSISEYKSKKINLEEQGYKVLEKITTGSGKKRVLVRRDYTKEERVEMGEIEDLSFAIAETGRLMASDAATAKFFNQVARNKNFTSDVAKKDFIQVDTKTIPGKTNVKRYGKLAGKFVHKDVYNDITRMYKLKDPSELQGAKDAFDTLQRTWKLSKTAWNPATHVNNTVSNFILLDFADTSVEMLVKAAKEMKAGDRSKLLELGKTYGIFDVDVISRELKGTTTELGGEVMKGLGKIANHDNIKDTVNYSNNIFKNLRKIKQATLGKLEDTYQFEDQIFRMAVFMDRLDKGFDVNKAAMEAKKWFIDYDINAPAINALRRTVTPFLSYTYRVIPLLAEAAILRPHKFAKWAAIGYGLNEIGKEFGGGNEELERVTMRDELSKKLYNIPFMPSRMIKLGWKSEAGDAQYLDVSRFVPGGDIFEQREGEGFQFPLIPAPFQPGGLLVDIPLLAGTKKNPFTGQDIEGLGLGKDKQAIGKAILQSLTPNVAGIGMDGIPILNKLPKSYATKKIEQAKNIKEGEPFYNVPGSEYAAKYSPLEALAYSFGIKLRPQNILANRKLKEIDYQADLKALQQASGKLKSQFRNGKIASKKELDEKLADIDIQRLKLGAEWALYVRKLNEARSKSVVNSRKSRATGGLIEGEDTVPFTKQNPAERVNPFTGLPYQKADLTEGGVLLGLLKDRVARVPKADGGISLSNDKVLKDFILKAEDINLYNDYKAGNLEKTIKAHTGSERFKELHKKPDKETMAGVTGSDVSETTVGNAVDNIFQGALEQTEQEYNRLIPEDVRNKTSVNNQRAMFSLLFNVGATNLQNSNALKSFKEGNIPEFYYEGFDRDFGFTKVTGSDNKKRTDVGLVNRRKAELNLAQGNLEDPMQIEEIVLPKRISLKERLQKRSQAKSA